MDVFLFNFIFSHFYEVRDFFIDATTAAIIYENTIMNSFKMTYRGIELICIYSLPRKKAFAIGLESVDHNYTHCHVFAF